MRMRMPYAITCSKGTCTGQCLYRGSSLIGKGGGVNWRIGREIGDVSGRISFHEGLHSRQACGTEGARGVIFERVIAIPAGVLNRRGPNLGHKIIFSGNVLASLGDPGCLEATSGTNVEVGVVLIDEFLEIIPKSVGRVERRKEEASAAEIIGENEMDGGAGELADRAGVERGFVATGDNIEDGEVERAGSIETGVVCREGRKWEREGNKEGGEEEGEEEGHGGGGLKVDRVMRKKRKQLSTEGEGVLHSARENPFLLIHEYDYKYRRSSLRLLNQKMETAEVLSTHSIDSFRRGWRINGSCNGLLCVELDTERGRFPISHLLWNPVMNEIVRLYHPELLKKKEDQISFDTLNRAQMFSLSTGLWKELEFGALNTELSDDAVCVNGNIFWVELGFFPMIVSFHIATEVFTFTTMQTLQAIVDDAENYFCPYKLDVHGNKLAMCDGTVIRDPRTYSIHMWVVEEGDSEFGNSLICTEKYKIGPLATVLKPLCIWRNQIVCIFVKGEVDGKGKGDLKEFLYLFNLTTKEWTKFHNLSAAYFLRVIFNYERSLVSVCNI
ncbi:hypothetical protein K1719_001779 [Acacia pycnantha]|nr:hypothetical protein K1719_001779 [Acacia pycnantha]